MPNDDQQIDDQQIDDTHVDTHVDDDTPSWTPPASQEEFDRILTKRLRQLERQKYKDIDVLREKAQKYDSLAATTQTEHEKAIEAAQAEAFGTALETYVPRLIRAEFRAAAKGVLTDEQLEALIEDVDLSRYVDDDGEPDLERIQRKIKAVAPRQPAPSFGQGNRGSGPKGNDMNGLIRSMAGVKA